MVCKCRLESGGPSYCWNELITLSTKYRDLTANSQLAVTVSMKRKYLKLSWCKSVLILIVCKLIS